MVYGLGITFIDIDETIFKTFAKIHILKNNKIIKKLSNQEFNKYKLQKDERYDFKEFKDGKLFLETSIPIKQTVELIKIISHKILSAESKSKIIFLTARSDFKNKEEFLEAFRKQDIDIDNKELMYVERSGNIKEGSISEKKEKIILKYLETGKYRRCRIIDDCEENINVLKKISENISKKIIKKIIELNNIKENEIIIEFWGFLVDETGKIKNTFNKKIIK